jgi:hypothetical protein
LAVEVVLDYIVVVEEVDIRVEVAGLFHHVRVRSKEAAVAVALIAM